MNPAILNIEVQEYIQSHLNDDLSRILFRGSPFTNISAKELVEQIESKKASEKKLPTWFNRDGIYYPVKLSIEQTSSEITASYKAGLVRGKSVIDLTGGFGVDSYFFSKEANSVTHCELNAELSAIAQHNARVLGEDNVGFINGNGIEIVRNSGTVFDTIYVDPSRRKTDKKVFLLSDCEPDITAHLDLLLAKAQRIIIKTSPLLDIQSGLRQLKNVSEVHIVSIKNDCKEVLWIIDTGFTGEPKILPVAIRDDNYQYFSFTIAEEREANVSEFFPPENYLYEPDVALMKAGCFKLITERFNVRKLHPNTHLYTSGYFEEGFFGKSFKVIDVTDFKTFSKTKVLSKANIISRNFPLSTEEIKKKLKLKDGGDDYLFFTTGPTDDLLTIHAQRV